MFKVIFTVVALFVTACYNASSNGISDNRASLDNNQTNSCVLPHSWNWLKKTHIALPNTSDENCSPIARLRCYCLTLDNSSSPPSLAFGHCLYGCFVVDVPSEYRQVSILRNHSLVSGSCSLFNREGILCGKCIEGHGSPVYSFSLKCVPCGHESLWATIPRYILMAYGPLTIFLAIIVIFTVSVNSAPLRGWIFVCQVLSANFSMRLITALDETLKSLHYSPFIPIIGSVYGIWNLDFFRSVHKPFCLHPSLTTLQVISLDYIIAAYPVVLILLMYVMVELYSRNYQPFVLMGRLFHHCFARFRHRLDIRTSLVDAFGTFFSLSFVKFLNTTSELLASTKVWNSNDSTTQYRIYYDGTEVLFRGDHIPYAVVGVLVILICNILPLVLILLYSFPKTHAIIYILPLSVQTHMFPFMDNILACYKDGTNGTKNCRYFGVVYHIALFCFIMCYMWTESVFLPAVGTCICIVTGMLVALIQPYKSRLYNTVDIILLLSIGLCFATIMCASIAYIEVPSKETQSIVMAMIPCTIPFFYSLGVVGYKSARCIRQLPCKFMICKHVITSHNKDDSTTEHSLRIPA